MWNLTAFIIILCYGCIFDNFLVVSSISTLTELQINGICRGLEFQYLSHPTEQQNYIICVPGGGIEQECPTSECFDERNPPCSNVCITNTNAADQATKDYCKDDDTALLDRVADDKNCGSYFICIGKNKDPLFRKCPTHQHFSAERKTCLSFHEANCATSTKWCKKRKNGIRFPHATCHKYYECQNETTIVTSCLYGEHFSSDLGKCMSGICQDDKRIPNCKGLNDGERVVHVKCYKYYVCLNRSAFEVQCPSGYYFNKIQGSCVRDVNNNCNDI